MKTSLEATSLLFLLLLEGLRCQLTNSDVIVQSDLSGNKASSGNKWKIVFYTGGDVWAGTDSEIYVELIGDFGNSKIIILKPEKSQMEAKSVDSFDLGNLDGKELGL